MGGAEGSTRLGPGSPDEQAPDPSNSAMTTARNRFVIPTLCWQPVLSAGMTDEPRRIAWAALETGTPIVARDGEEIGRVTTVVADETKDIFSGVAFRQGLLEAERFLPADLIDEMTENSVTAAIGSEDAAGLEAYNA